MGNWARAKSTLGGDQPGTALASVAALNIPDNRNYFVITGSTTISSIVGATHLRDREITLRGGSGAVVTLTNNNSPAANQMNLRGTDRTLYEDTIIQLFNKGDNTWTLIGVQ